MDVTFHSTHCPKCKVLEMKLKKKNIQYQENNDVDIMLSKGLQSAPALEVDGKLYGFKEAVDFVNSYEEQ